MLRVTFVFCLLQGAALLSGCGDSSPSDGATSTDNGTGGETIDGETTDGGATGQETTGADTSGNCGGFLESYLSTLADARSCENGGDCSFKVSNTMFCGCPTWVSSDTVAAELRAIRKSSDDAGCPVPACPAVDCSDLPPAVCKEGGCWPRGQDPVCLGLQDEISQGFNTGGACVSDVDCSAWVDGGLGCSCGDFVTSADSATQLSGLISNYSDENCHVLSCGVCPPPNYVAHCENGQCTKEHVSCQGITNQFEKALQAAKACTEASECKVVDNLGLDCACPQYLAVSESIVEAQSLADTYQKGGCAHPCGTDCAPLGTAACLDGECRSEP